MILNGFKKIILKNSYVELETPPSWKKNILSFHFDYLHLSYMRKVDNLSLHSVCFHHIPENKAKKKKLILNPII